MADTRPTREQERAQAAYSKVSGVAASDTGWKQDYGRQCRHLPALIHQSGLCQTLTFLAAKGAADKKKGYFQQVLDDLACVTKIEKDGKALTAAVRTADMQKYQWMSREALACAQWLKRYTEALGLGSEEGTEP